MNIKILFAIFCTAFLSSCQRTFTCECTNYDQSTGQYTTTTHQVTGTIDQADNDCRNTPAPNSQTITSCTLIEEGGYGY